MERIKMELEPEFEEILEHWVSTEFVLHEMEAEDPEYQRVYDEIQSKGRAFATRFNTLMFDVLTDAQWIRLQRLIDNPPEHALVFRRALKGLSDEDEKSTEPTRPEVWVPGPGSWRPGDAIPGEYRIERNTRLRQFPRGE
jgi:hypothetical protein